MTYVPRIFSKAGLPDRKSISPSHEAQLRWDGYLPTGQAVPPDLNDIGASLGDLMDEVLELTLLPTQRRVHGPLAPAHDIPVFTAAPAFDANAYGRSYAISGSTRPADYPIDEGFGRKVPGSNYVYAAPLGNNQLLRFKTDGDRFCMPVFFFDPAYEGFQMFVNGAPVATAHQTFATGATFPTWVFPDARPREIEILCSALIGGIYIPERYQARKPPPAATPKVLGLGASWLASTVWDTAGRANIVGIGAQLGLRLGIEKTWWTDAIGGTGWLVGGVGDRFAERLALHHAAKPEALVVMNPFENDLFTGNSVAATVDAMCDALEEYAAAVPGSKIIIFEPVRPPVFTDYFTMFSQATTQAKARLDKIGAYWIKTDSWITGTGHVGAVQPTGNSSIYIGNDQSHYTPAGARYFVERAADAIRTVLLDTEGALINTRI